MTDLPLPYFSYFFIWKLSQKKRLRDILVILIRKLLKLKCMTHSIKVKKWTSMCNLITNHTLTQFMLETANNSIFFKKNCVTPLSTISLICKARRLLCIVLWCKFKILKFLFFETAIIVINTSWIKIREQQFRFWTC